jgi:hypothetical protein
MGKAPFIVGARNYRTYVLGHLEHNRLRAGVQYVTSGKKGRFYAASGNKREKL